MFSWFERRPRQWSVPTDHQGPWTAAEALAEARIALTRHARHLAGVAFMGSGEDIRPNGRAHSWDLFLVADGRVFEVLVLADDGYAGTVMVRLASHGAPARLLPGRFLDSPSACSLLQEMGADWEGERTLTTAWVQGQPVWQVWSGDQVFSLPFAVDVQLLASG